MAVGQLLFIIWLSHDHVMWPSHDGTVLRSHDWNIIPLFHIVSCILVKISVQRFNTVLKKEEKYQCSTVDNTDNSSNVAYSNIGDDIANILSNWLCQKYSQHTSTYSLGIGSGRLFFFATMWASLSPTYLWGKKENSFTIVAWQIKVGFMYCSVYSTCGWAAVKILREDDLLCAQLDGVATYFIQDHLHSYHKTFITKMLSVLYLHFKGGWPNLFLAFFRKSSTAWP